MKDRVKDRLKESYSSSQGRQIVKMSLLHELKFLFLESGFLT